MGAAFWARRFVLVLAGAFTVIASVQLLKGRELASAVVQGLGWAAVAATVFTLSRFHQTRRGQHCAICRDTPEMRDPEGRPEGGDVPVADRRR